MSAKHTPGPWEVRTLDMSLGSIDSKSGIQVAQAQEISVADRNSGHSERIANARLIAAAPELLEALVYARRFLKPEDYDVDYVASVIAKALGEQP